MQGLIIISIAVMWVCFMILATVTYALARQVGLLHERLAPAGALQVNQAIKAGDPAPIMSAETLDKTPVQIGGPRERALLIYFLSPTCPVCKSLLPAVKRSQTAERDWLDVIYASDGDYGHEEFAAAHDIAPSHYVVSEILGRSFGVSKLPYAVLVGTDGNVSSLGLVNTREHLESLFVSSETGVYSIQDYVQSHSPQKQSASGI